MKMSKNMFCDKKLLNSEDSVEKFFLDRLIQELGFKDIEIKTKISIKELVIGKGSSKSNHKPDYVLYKNKLPVLVIDAKATKEDVKKYLYQTSNYSLALNQTFKGKNPIKYFILSNGYITELYNWDEDKPILTLKFEDFEKTNKKYLKLKDIISSKKLEIEEKLVQNFKFEKISTAEIDGIFRACHNLIWKKETINPTDAFYEFCKLFFIKLKQDKDIHINYINQGLEPPLNEFKFSDDWIKKQDANNPVNDILFKQHLLPFLKKERDEKGKKRIFEDDENINLQSATIKEVVKLLQHIDFYNIDEDLNGRMFETFLSATVRGKDLGQFFTPRSVVKFMVKMANLTANKEKVDVIYDGCSGSGGFLIDAMADIVKKIENIKSLSNKEKEELLDKIYRNNIYGSEKSLKNSRVTRMNLWFHGDGSSNIYCLDTLDKKFRYDKSLSDERKDEIEEMKNKILGQKYDPIKKEYVSIPPLKFNVIFTNPPFSTRYEWAKPDEKEVLEDYDISYKELNKDKNDRVASLKSNVMFIERYYDLLEKGGKLLTVIDESVLNADQEKYFRKYILSKFILKAVISLPRNTFTNADTGTKTSILYLKKKISEDEEQTPVFMAISNNVGHTDSGKSETNKCDLYRIFDEKGNIVNSKLKTTILEEFNKFENGN